MIGRIIAAIAFLAGGAFTWFVLALLKALAASQAGMSAGPVPGPPEFEALIPWFAVSYFVGSAFGLLLCHSRTALRAAAAVAHSLLLITFLFICLEAQGEGPEKFLTGLLTLSVITALYFSPWFIVWAIFLFTTAKSPEADAPPNFHPATQPGNSDATEPP